MLLAGCQKPGGVGSAIRFRAVAVSDAADTKAGDPATKTSYSGVVTAGKERIDWVAGDKIRIKSDVATTSSSANYADYTLGTISASGANSNAEATADGDNGLLWGTGSHNFWAIYPSTTTLSSTTLGDDYTASAIIPPAQRVFYASKKEGVVTYKPDMKTAFMVAGLQTSSTSSGIDLEFDPAVTTFDITVGANSNFTITAAQMVTTASPLSGTVLATFNPSTSMSHTFSASGTGQTIDISFWNADNTEERIPAVSTTTVANFKLFALPMDITGASLRFTLGTGTTWKIDLKRSNGDWLDFPACGKINITGLLVPGAEWYINFDGPREESWVLVPEIEIGVE